MKKNNKSQINENSLSAKSISNSSLDVADKIVAISLGCNHSSALSSSGRVFTWGENNEESIDCCGQLGNGTYVDSESPFEITQYFYLTADDKIINMYLGSGHSSALSLKGRVFTWGDNTCGQLGDSSKTTRWFPTDITKNFRLSDGDKIVSISLGSYKSLVLSSLGRVFTWGEIEESGYILIPKEITDRFELTNEDKIVAISLSKYSFLYSAISSKGRVFTWGDNTCGQLGDGTLNNRSLPTEITSKFSLASDDRIVDMSLGDRQSSALSSSGRVFTWGYNSTGKIGDGTTNDRLVPTEITHNIHLGASDKIVAISLGHSHSSALSLKGHLFTWGWGACGVLGNGTKGLQHFPNEITDLSISYTKDNKTPISVDNLISISLGYQHSAAISSSGRVFTWGDNEFGQLGNGSTNGKSFPDEITFKFFLEENYI